MSEAERETTRRRPTKDTKGIVRYIKKYNPEVGITILGTKIIKNH